MYASLSFHFSEAGKQNNTVQPAFLFVWKNEKNRKIRRLLRLT